MKILTSVRTIKLWTVVFLALATVGVAGCHRSTPKPTAATQSSAPPTAATQAMSPPITVKKPLPPPIAARQPKPSQQLSTPAVSVNTALAAVAIEKKWYPMPHYGKWVSCRIGGGGYVQNVVACPTDPRRYYCYIDVGGLYRSDDGGFHWVMLHGHLPANRGCYSVRGLSVDPRNANKVIIATGDQWNHTGIFFSSNAGNTWRCVAPHVWFDGNGSYRGAGLILARNPSNPDVVLAASKGTGLWKSVDDGQTWRMIGMRDINPTDIKYDRTNPRRLWICAMAGSGSYNGKSGKFAPGFYRSTDGGKNWKKLLTTGPDEVAQDSKNANLLYGVFPGSVVERSLDAGTTWQPFHQGIPTNPKYFGSTTPFGHSALAVGPGFILAGSDNGDIFKLNSGQTVWQRINRSKIHSVGVAFGARGWGWAMGSLIVDHNNPRHWFETDFFGLSQTFNAGRTWTMCDDGIEDTVVHSITQDPTDPGVVHLGMADNGYFNSTDGGVRFTSHTFPRSAITCKDVVLCAKLPDRVYAIGTKLWDQQIKQVFVSIDRGNTWVRSPMIGLPAMNHWWSMCNSIAIDPNNPYTVYLGVSGPVKPGAGGPYKSTDGGKTWKWIGQGLPASKSFFWNMEWVQGNELAAGPDGSMVAISRMWPSTGIYRYSPKTQRWSGCAVPNIPGSPDSVVADVLTPGRYFVGVAGGCIYRSTDDGRQWHKVYNKSAYFVSLDLAKPDREAASTDDGVILSTDGGDTWKMLDQSLPDRSTGNMSAFIGDRLVVGSNGSGAFWIPLSAAGKKSVHANPIVLAKVPASMRQPVQAPKVDNVSFIGGGKTPASWNLKIRHGDMKLLRIPGVLDKEHVALSLKSVGGAAQGSAYQTFPAVNTPFRVLAWAKIAGKGNAYLAVKVYNAQHKRIGVIWIGNANSGGAWINAVVTLPPGAVTCSLAYSFHGRGQAWLSGLWIASQANLADIFP